jgi:hypothetical protein
VPELTGCCSPCGIPQIGAFAGVNPKYLDAFRAETCTTPNPACLKCLTGSNPNIGARCVTQHCKAFDVRSVPEYSKCTTNSDCQLRSGVGCCECGGEGWVAVNASGWKALVADVCMPNAGCPDCLPQLPDNTTAQCVQGHCEVAINGSCQSDPGIHGCCFEDADCGGDRCYGAACDAKIEGVCKPVPKPGFCWGDRDCPGGQSCSGVRVCPCGASCLIADQIGTCAAGSVPF